MFFIFYTTWWQHTPLRTRRSGVADRSIVEEESLDPNLGTSTRRAVPHILVAVVFQKDPSDYLGEEPRILAKRSAGSKTRPERKNALRGP